MRPTLRTRNKLGARSVRRVTISQLPEKGGLISNNLAYRYETGESAGDSPVSLLEPGAPHGTRT